MNGLVYAATALLIFTGQIKPWHVYVTAFLMAIAQAFQQPARASMIADAVPPAYLTNAIGLNAMIFNVSRSTGPALAGMLIAVFGTGAAYSVQAVFFFLATVWTMQLRPAQRSSASCRRSLGSRGILRSEYHRRMEVQLEERGSSHRSPHRDVCFFVHRPLHDAFARVCARPPESWGFRAGVACYRYGYRCAVQRGSYRIRRRKTTKGHAHAGIRGAIRLYPRDLCGITLVPAIDGDDGDRRPLPRALQRPCANRYPILLSFRITRPHDGNI